ncbi:MAG TPA: acyl-CoA dehydrogenase family protein [Ilumatobacter sp.]|nr:acyl-CoA dehydrogenase family protein [Ilumatobacter sp.]
MDLDLSEDERMLGAVVREFVGRAAPRDHLLSVREGATGFDPAWLRPMADAGWLGMHVPAALGGSDATALQCAEVFRELGRGPVTGPWLASSAVAAGLLRACVPSDAAEHVLTGIATGQAIVVPTLHAHPPGSTRDPVRMFVPYAAAATHLLVDLSGDHGVEFVLVDLAEADVTIERLPGFNEWSYRVSFGDLDGRVGMSTLGRPDDPASVERALDIARLVVSAYRVGGCERVLEMSVEHASTRIQFGQPIGRFQRVQDHVVRIVNSLDAARWATYEALWRADTGRNITAAAALASQLSSEGYVEATNAAHEVHAGVGSDPAFGLTLYTEAARALYHYLGSPRRHRRRLGRELLGGAT